MIRIGAKIQADISCLDIANASAETPLFPGHVRRSALADVMDRVNAKYGGDTVIVGAMVGTKGSAPVRISFTQIPQPGEF